MEMITISLCFATILAFLFLKQILKPATTTNRNLPPSPPRLPVIGNIHQLSLHPHRSLRHLSIRYGPLMLLHFGRVPILVVSSADIAHDVMKTHDLKFANRPKTKAVDIFLNGGRDVAFSSYGEYWRQMKSLCSVHLLSKKMVRSFENIREEEIVTMMEKLKKASSSSLPVNLSESLLNLTNNVICRIAMGRKYILEENTSEFGNLLRTIMELLGAFPVGDYIRGLAWVDKIRGLDRKMEEVSKTFREFLDGVVQEHVDEGEKKETFDFVDMLLQIQREKTSGFELARSDINLIMLDIFLAGMATSYTTLDWAMMLLIRHPECMKKLQDEIRTCSRHEFYVLEEQVESMRYLKAVIKEVLRLHPPGPLLAPRQLSEDVKLKGYDIAAGTQVIINAWAIHRDTTTWGPDAEEFKPERHLDLPLDFSGQDFKYIPFGSGRRLCPGIGFAMALIEVTLANLVNRFNWKVEIRPNGDDDHYYLAETTGIEVGRKFPLFVFPSLASSTL
ncbi:Cytochrome P450 71A15 [Raphanus sativus]|uniref:Cytochrome P450 71A28 n=1 Tax=Raphanus sativus TaxID=3726 RepID=A0A6J0L0X0_RAPSA|nr:putative cytochrome P450 71A28 [Raphanus sativus]KAJ4912354.1 Cytochrome P450 71A15 [Raphanus sativus]